MRHSTFAATMPDQLAHVREDDADRIIVDGCLEGQYELDSGAGGDCLLADDAVGEDAEVLDGFAEEDYRALGGGEIGGGEDGDVRFGGGGANREAENRETTGGEAREDNFADAC